MAHELSQAELSKLVSRRIQQDQAGLGDFRMYVDLAVMMLTQTEPPILTDTENVDPHEVWRLVVPVACTVLRECGVLNEVNAELIRTYLQL